MHATVIYRLTESGRKASILAGGDGKKEQRLTVAHTDPEFAPVVQLATVASDGSISHDFGGQYTEADCFGAPQTVASLLTWHSKKGDVARLADEERAAKVSADTMRVLAEKSTRTESFTVWVDRGGEKVDSCKGVTSTPGKKRTIDWPYEADQTVVASPEAAAWLAEVKAANAAALEAALTEARAKLPVLLAAEAAAAQQAETARQAKLTCILELGGEAGDLLLRVENGALCSVPAKCWESHSRGENWLATIVPNPSSPGGLERSFAAKARGDSYYLLAGINVGDVLEFGADYYSGGGRKSPERWYGFVVALTPDAMICRPVAGGKSAYKAAQKWLETHPAVTSVVR